MSKTTGAEEVLEAAEAPEAAAPEAERAQEAGKAEEAGRPEAEADADASAGKADADGGEAEEDAAPVEKPVSKAGAEEPEKAEKAEKAEKPQKTEDPKKAEPEAGSSGGGLAARLNSGIALIAALVLLVVSVGVSAFLWRAHSNVSDELSTQQQVRTRAAEFVRAFLVYEKSDLDGWEERLKALAAPEYRTAIGQSVKMQFPVITNLEASSEAVIRDVFVNDFDGSVAKTMVVADTQVSSKEFVRTATGMRLLVELTYVKGQWLTSGVGLLGVDDETMTDHKGNELDPSKIEVPDVAPTTAP